MKFLIGFLFLAVTACAPKVYVLDRQTLIQEEAAGQFPDLEQSMGQRSLQSGPKMLDRAQLQQKEIPQRAYTILNGELTREQSSR